MVKPRYVMYCYAVVPEEQPDRREVRGGVVHYGVWGEPGGGAVDQVQVPGSGLTTPEEQKLVELSWGAE